jgi:hypothetical protein
LDELFDLIEATIDERLETLMRASRSMRLLAANPFS